MKVSFTLPWPDRVLSPNTHAHWSKKEAARKSAINTGYYAGREGFRVALLDEDICMTVRINPPDRRKHDVDNVLASLKPMLDGLTRGLGFDDSQIKRIVIDRRICVAGGEITISFENLVL
jgi:crossover junction endodeoxyribonuclease RusA